MESVDINCYLCDRQFCDQNLPRMLPACCHTYCQSCIRKLMKAEPSGGFKLVCPQDHKEMQFDDKDIHHCPKNIGLIKAMMMMAGTPAASTACVKSPRGQQQIKMTEIKTYENNNNKGELTDRKMPPKKPDINLSKPQIQTPKRANQSKTKLQFPGSPRPAPIKSYQRINPTTNEQKQASNNNLNINNNEPLEDMCLIHNRPLEIICVDDLNPICSNCAIFGDHKGHNFKSITQVQKDRLNKQKQILDLIDRKEAFDNNPARLKAKEQAQTNQDLRERKQALCDEVRKSFSKLRQIIEESEKKCIQSIESHMKALQSRLTKITKLAQTPLQEYNKWQGKAFKALEELDAKDNLPKQIALLNYSQKSDTPDLVSQGTSILNRLQQTDQEDTKSRRTYLDSVRVSFSEYLQKQLVKQYFELTSSDVDSKNSKSGNATEQTKFTHQRVQSALPTIQSPLRHHSNPPLVEALENDDLLLEQVGSKSFLEQNHLYSYNSLGAYASSPNLFEPVLLSPNMSAIQPQQPHSATRNLSTQVLINNVLLGAQEKPRVILLSSPQRSSLKRFHSGNKDPKSPRKAPETAAFLLNSNNNPIKPQDWLKKKQKLNLPTKYEKIVENIILSDSNTECLLDLTNAQLGDQTVLQILELLSTRNLKTVKLIRNKLSDDILGRLWDLLPNVAVLNLSQNNLTDRVLESLVQNRDRLPNLRGLVLSQNKIYQRNSKTMLEELKAMQLSVSL